MSTIEQVALYILASGLMSTVILGRVERNKALIRKGQVWVPTWALVRATLFELPAMFFFDYMVLAVIFDWPPR